VSAAARLSILVDGGGAPPVPKNRRRRCGAGGQKHIFLRFPEKISCYPLNFLLTFLFCPLNFLMTCFSHPKLQQNNYAATMASSAAALAAARRSTKVGGGVPARPTHGSSLGTLLSRQPIVVVKPERRYRNIQNE